MITIAESSWHPECLKCNQCQRVLTNYNKIYKKNNKPVCPGCVQSVFNLVENETTVNNNRQSKPPNEMKRNTNMRGRGNSRGSIRQRGGAAQQPNQRGSSAPNQRASINRGSINRGNVNQNGNTMNRNSSRDSLIPKIDTSNGSNPNVNPDFSGSQNFKDLHASSRDRLSRNFGRPNESDSSPSSNVSGTSNSPNAPRIPSNMPTDVPLNIPTDIPDFPAKSVTKPRCSIRLTKKPDKRKSLLPSRTERSIAEILTNINYVLADDRAVNSILDFMIGDYSVENLLFYLDAIQFFEMNLPPHDMKIYANSIWNKYFTQGGDMEVNISASIRNMVKNRLSEPSQNMFGDAVSEVVRLMELCTLPRFQKSAQAKKLLEAYPQ